MLNFGKMRIALKLPGLVVMAALVSVVAIGVANYMTAANELQAAAERQLTALAAARKATLDSYLGSVREDLAVLSENQTVRNALRDLSAGYDEAAAGGQSAEQVLQRQYIQNNPNTDKKMLDRAADDTAYNRAHGLYHPWLRQVLEERGYYDIFLIDASGDVVYTVFKEPDFATNLENGRWRDTDIAKVFEKTRNLRDGKFAFADFAAYAPSDGAAASFIAMPVLDGGTYIGALAFQMPVGRINTIMQERTGMGETGETYLVGQDLLMRSDSRFSKDSTILKTKVDTATVRQALAGQTGGMETPDYRGTPVFSVYAPTEFGGVRWAIMAELDMAEIMQPVYGMRDTMLIIAFGVLVAVGIVGLLVARGIVGPIVLMTDVMRALAGGDKQIAIPATDRVDEIGEMAKAVLVFKENMIKADTLAAAQEAERKAKEARAVAVEKMIGTFDKGVAEVLGGVASAATELERTAQAMSATAEQASHQATAVSAASNQASANVQTVATAAEELSASISEIGRQVSQSAEIAASAVREAEKTNATVRGLADAAQKIGDVVSLINNIAGQTNLLALNATIEAARAGEAGKGFAVVAQEVKNLANQTSKATEEISAQILSVQQETHGAVAAIEKIREVISEINDISTTIASAVEEQGVSTQEIARNVQQAAQGTQAVNSNISGVTDAANQTGAAASQVLSSSGELTEQSERLRNQVDAFLRDVRAA